MSHPHHGKRYWDTHYCCNARLKKEGGKSKCCECHPHKKCELKPLSDLARMKK